MSFSATRPIYSYKCQVKILFRKYMAAMLLLTAALIFIVIKIRSFIYSYRVKSLASQLYKELKNDLDRMGSGASAGISEKEIYQKFMSTDALKSAVRRDNLTFMDLVMPQLDKLRRNDSKISIVERV